jgi:asparagine synthase (glutamine-hydrolysing)
MCGIAGLIHFDGRGQGPERAELLGRMARRMSHRGPDDEGLHQDGPLGFAFRRLSILDLSSSGHQPMVSEDGAHALIYNGETYNFRELRAELEARGHRFRSHTDSEVVLRGLMEHGMSFVDRMVGMWGFAYWNRAERALYLCRDRFGIKPLYLYRDKTRAVFSSEIKPILETGVEPVLDYGALSGYLSLRYTPGPRTLFEGIRKIEPGTWVRLGADGSFHQHVYWNLLDQVAVRDIPEAEAQDRYLEMLERAVESCRIADVPVGAFLSSGIDSSAIAALLRRRQENVETFTFGIGAGVDESDAARRTAQYLGVNNELTRLRADDYEYLPRAVWHLEEPIGDAIIVPTYRLAEAAARKVKVIQLGEGADEILAGYVHQLAMTYGNLVARAVPSAVRRGGVRLLRHLPEFFWDKVFPYPAKLGRSGVEKVINYLGNADTPARAYLGLIGLFREEETRKLVPALGREPSGPLYLESAFTDFWSRAKNPDFQNVLSQVDLKFWNTDFGMLRSDKLTMAHSLEARVPYLDHRLVEFCLSLPRKFKTRRFRQKILMREALGRKGILPREVTEMPKKGFYLPIEKCFDGRFDAFTRDILSARSMKERGVFDPAEVGKLLEHGGRELLHNKQLVVLLVFELWARQYLDGRWRDGPSV